MRTCIVVALLIIVVVSQSPPQPDYPVKELCASYKQKCEIKFKRSNCDQRVRDCEQNCNNGLKTVWNFCMYAQAHNPTSCYERMDIEFEIIKKWVNKDDFNFFE